MRHRILSGPTNMLVDKENGNILSLLREVLERSLDRWSLSLGVDHEEVSLGIRWICDMLQSGRFRVSMPCASLGPHSLVVYVHLSPRVEGLSPSWIAVS